MIARKQILSASKPREISLQNDLLRITVLPNVGGKISELVDLASGRNWFWHNADLPFTPAEYGSDYGSLMDSGGWDEVLMSMSPAQLELADGRVLDIPDHGDLVGRSWQVDDVTTHSNGDETIRMSVHGRSAKFLFSRDIRLPAGSRRLEISYSLVNKDDVALPWYWSAHGLLAADPKLRINLPLEQSFRVDALNADESAADCATQQWPHLRTNSDHLVELSKAFASTQQDNQLATKIFVRSPADGTASVQIGESNERLVVQFDAEQLPWLGLWINNRRWSGSGDTPHYNLGLEPTTTCYDDVREAVENKAVEWIQPGERREWTLSLELHS